MTFNFLNYYTRMAFSQPAIQTNKIFLDHSSLPKSSKDIGNKIQKHPKITGERQLQKLKILNYPRTPTY